MSAYLNDVLYQQKMFDSFDKISLLERFMYTSATIDPVKSESFPCEASCNQLRWLPTDGTDSRSETSHSATSRPVFARLERAVAEGAGRNTVGVQPALLGERGNSGDDCRRSSTALHETPPSATSRPVTSAVGNNLLSESVTDGHVESFTGVTDSYVKDSIIYPKHDDTLFWCAYIAKYEYGDYLAIGTKYKNKEIEKKQELINMIRKTPTMLKGGTRKITNVAIQEILAELMIDKKTSMQSFYAICVLYKLQVFMVDVCTNTYMNIGVEDSNDKFIVYRSESLNSVSSKSDHNMGRRQPSKDGMYSIDLYTTQSKIDKITADMLEIESGPKPIKGISSYKVDELEAMANKLGICFSDTKMKKSELYALILNKCEWV